MTIKIELKKTGFPVKIGNTELWFDSSIENIKRFLNIHETVNEKYKKVNEIANSFDLPDDLTKIDAGYIESIDPKKIDEAYEVNKDYISEQYDIIFGEGAFDKLYKENPDLNALELALEPVINAILEKTNKEFKGRREEFEKIKEEYFKMVNKRR